MAGPYLLMCRAGNLFLSRRSFLLIQSRSLSARSSNFGESFLALCCLEQERWH